MGAIMWNDFILKHSQKILIKKIRASSKKPQTLIFVILHLHLSCIYIVVPPWWVGFELETMNLMLFLRDFMKVTTGKCMESSLLSQNWTFSSISKAFSAFLAVAMSYSWCIIFSVCFLLISSPFWVHFWLPWLSSLEFSRALCWRLHGMLLYVVALFIFYAYLRVISSL